MQVWELKCDMDRVRHPMFSGATKVVVVADGRELYLDDAYYKPEKNVFCLVTKRLDGKEDGISKEDI